MKNVINDALRTQRYYVAIDITFQTCIVVLSRENKILYSKSTFMNEFHYFEVCMNQILAVMSTILYLKDIERITACGSAKSALTIYYNRCFVDAVSGSLKQR